MNSKNFSSKLSKTTAALAIAFAAASPAMAGTAAPSWAAGYPVGELQDFELPPSTRAPVVAETPAPMVSAETPEATSSLAGADASVAYGENEARSQQQLSAAEVQPIVLPQGVVTRDSVRAEYLAAREAGTLTPANEVGDTPQVLAARDAFNDEQAQSIVAEYQAEYDRRVAMQEAEIRRAAIEAEWMEVGVAQSTMYDDPTAEVQIDVISLQPEALGE